MGHQSTKVDGIVCSGRRVTNYQTNLSNIREGQNLHVPFSDCLNSCVVSGCWASRMFINIRRTRFVRNTYLLIFTSWSKVLLEKLIVSQLLK